MISLSVVGDTTLPLINQNGVLAALQWKLAVAPRVVFTGKGLSMKPIENHGLLNFSASSKPYPDMHREKCGSPKV